MPPPKPSTSPDDERRRDAAAEAERLGREHSNKRDMQARAERARATDERRTGLPGLPGAPVVQPRRPESRVPDAEPPGREGRTPAAPRPATRTPERAAERGPERADRDRSVDRGLERPVPPTSERAAERPPERPADRPADRAPDRPPPRPAPTERPVERPAPRAVVVEEPPASVIDEVAVEAEDLLREGGTLWRRFSMADKITVFSAVIVLLGTLLPWLHRPHEEVALGVGSGGVVHVVLAVLAIVLLVRRDRSVLDDRGLRPSASKQKQLARRTALWMLLLSLTSTVAGTWFLLVYGMVRRFEVPTLEIGAGLYVSLAAGLGLSYSGFAFFWRASKGDSR